MYTKLFHRLPNLLCLFQITCFAALQRIPLHSSSFSACSDEHKKIDVVCNSHLGGLGIEPSGLENELLVYGFIREFEPKVTKKIIPDCIKNLCVDFSRRILPCDCIKRKYRKIFPKLDIDEDRKKALIFFLMYKIEDVRDEKNKLRRTILHYACGNGNLELAKLLRKWGANINATDKYRDNALHLACLWSESEDMITWLLDECKIGLEIKGFAQRTPFLCAAYGGHLEIAKLLRQRGANINAKDAFGRNALDLVKIFGKNKELISYLKSQSRIKTGRCLNFWSRWF